MILRKFMKRKALTILELLVVLPILVTLGGLVISILPDVLRRTHLAKCADTIANLNAAWMRSYALNVRYPDVYDSLLATGGSALYGPLTPGLTGEAGPMTLTAGDVAALRAVGITRVVDLAHGLDGRQRELRQRAAGRDRPRAG